MLQDIRISLWPKMDNVALFHNQLDSISGYFPRRTHEIYCFRGRAEEQYSCVLRGL